MKVLKTVCLAAGAMMLVANVRADGMADKLSLNLDAGVAFVPDVTIKTAPPGKAQLDTGVRADIGLGYAVNESWSVGIESGVVWNQGKNSSGDLYQIPALFTATYHYSLNESWTLCIGGGAGGVWTDVDSGGSSQDDFVFGYQASVGLGYKLSDKAHVGFGYKFLGTTEHEFSGVKTDGIYTHAFGVGFNWKF